MRKNLGVSKKMRFNPVVEKVAGPSWYNPEEPLLDQVEMAV